MYEHTNYVAGHQKRCAGQYYSLTYAHAEHPAPGIPSYSPVGAFGFEKQANGKWLVTFQDYTAYHKVTRAYGELQRSLKDAHEYAQRIVRGLPANVARRREWALKGAMPVAVVGY